MFKSFRFGMHIEGGKDNEDGSEGGGGTDLIRIGTKTIQL